MRSSAVRKQLKKPYYAPLSKKGNSQIFKKRKKNHWRWSTQNKMTRWVMIQSFAILLFASRVYAGFSSCNGPETAAIASCQSDCDPAVTADNESELSSCTEWQCHMHCAKHTDDISSACLNKQRDECKRYTSTDPLNCRDVDCNSTTRPTGDAWVIVGLLGMTTAVLMHRPLGWQLAGQFTQKS